MKPVHLAVILLVTVLVSLFNPFSLTAAQSVVLGALMFAVGCWATGALDRTLTSLLLLLLFLLFGNTEPLSIIGFLWSDVFLLMAVSGLLAVALGRNKLLRSWLSRLITGAARNHVVFYAMPYLLGLILIFLIPQAFARVLLLAGIYNSVMDQKTEDNPSRQAVFMYLYMAVTVTSMTVLDGDIILNRAAVQFGGAEVAEALTGSAWFSLMGVPSLAASLLMCFIMLWLFRKELPKRPSSLFSERAPAVKTSAKNKRKDWAGLFVMVIVMLFWASESLHGVPGWLAALAGVVILFLLGELSLPDLNAVNPRFLIFLMAAFNIGRVLGQSGVMAAIMDKLQVIIPSKESFIFMPALVFFTMLLHMFIGSAVATLSVALPFLVQLAGAAGIPPVQLTLMLYVTVNLHFFMPFHHATMMIGVANGHFTDRHMIRYGLFMTVGIFVVIFGVYLPWWQLIR